MAEDPKHNQVDANGQSLQQEIEDLKHQNEALMKRMESLEGAVVANLEHEISSLDAGERNKIFQNYQAILVNNFTDSVIQKLFDSSDFVGQMLQATWQKFRTWRGVVSLLGISGLGAIGILALVNQMNHYILTKADEVFEKQIDAKAPAMLERLERDRETIMLLTLDISAQDQVNLPILGVSDMGIDPVREAYLDNNADYEKILIDFLKGDSNSPLQNKIIRADSRNKAILRYYALNYILQVNPDNDLKEALLAVLKDENIELKVDDTGSDSISIFINRLDVRNQILAIRALRRHKNQMNRLANEVLINTEFDYLYDNSTFWRGFLNELIFMPLEEPFDTGIVKNLLASSWLKEDENRGEIASTILLLFTLYPDLCEDNCKEKLEPLIEQVKASLRQGEESSPGKTPGISEGNTFDELEPNAEIIDDSFNCSRYLTVDNLEFLLSYRLETSEPANSQGLSELLGTFDCVLVLYHQDWQNFAFFQEPVLFYGGQDSAIKPGISNLLTEYVNLYWQAVERGYLGSNDDYYRSSLNNAINFYSRVGETPHNQDATPFYRKLLTDSDTAYQAWIAEELYTRATNSQITSPVLNEWLSYNGYNPEDIRADAAIYIEDFVNSIAWSATEQRYISSSDHDAIVNVLAQGSGINLYLTTMSTGYFPEDIWLSQIFPMFEAYWDDVVDYDQSSGNYYLSHEEGIDRPEISGISGEQDALWQWIKLNYEADELIFNAEDQKWQSKET